MLTLAMQEVHISLGTATLFSSLNPLIGNSLLVGVGVAVMIDNAGIYFIGSSFADLSSSAVGNDAFAHILHQVPAPALFCVVCALAAFWLTFPRAPNFVCVCAHAWFRFSCLDCAVFFQKHHVFGCRAVPCLSSHLQYPSMFTTLLSRAFRCIQTGLCRLLARAASTSSAMYQPTCKCVSSVYDSPIVRTTHRRST
jgi:hypothetical protein